MILPMDMIAQARDAAANNMARLPKPGAYVGIIIKATEIEGGNPIINRFGKRCVRMYVDITEGEYAGVIAHAGKATGKYPRYGVYDVELPRDDGTYDNDKAADMMIMMIRNIIASNPDMPDTLARDTREWTRRRIGLVFRRRAYTAPDGTQKAAIDLWYLCSTDPDGLAWADAQAKDRSDPLPARQQQPQTSPWAPQQSPATPAPQAQQPVPQASHYPAPAPQAQQPTPAPQYQAPAPAPAPTPAPTPAPQEPVPAGPWAGWQA